MIGEVLGPNNEDDTRAFVRRTAEEPREEPRRGYEFGAVMPSEDLLIGACGPEIRSVTNREGEIGYCLNRDYWGRGYASEMALARLSIVCGARARVIS